MTALYSAMFALGTTMLRKLALNKQVIVYLSYTRYASSTLAERRIVRQARYAEKQYLRDDDVMHKCMILMQQVNT